MSRSSVLSHLLMPKEKLPVAVRTTFSQGSPITVKKDSSLLIPIYAKPGSKQSCITGVSEKGFAVAIAAHPHQGAANSELREFIAFVLRINKRHISLEKGGKSRNKVLKVAADAQLSKEDIEAKLISSIDT